MKNIITVLALMLGMSSAAVAQIKDAYKIRYATFDEYSDDKEEVSHEVYVNDEKIKIVLPIVFPNRIFLGDKTTDQARLVYPSLLQYVTYPAPDSDIATFELIPGKTKVVAGYTCKFAQLQIPDMEEYEGNNTLDVWYTEELPKVYWSNFDELRSIPGAALEITAPLGLTMLAVDVNKSELSEHDFILSEDYEEIDEMYIPTEKDRQVAANLFLYQDSESGYYGLEDEQQRKITPAEYRDISGFQYGVAVAEHANEKYGTIDQSGKVIIPFIYDNVINDYNSDQFMVELDQTYGILDHDGATIIPINYDYVSFLYEGYAVFTADGLSGIINANNEVIIPAKYPVIVSNNSTHFITIEKNDSYKLMNLKTNKAVASGYDYLSTTDEPDLFLAQKKGKTGFLNGQGKVAIPLIYESASTFKDGESYVITDKEEAFIINTKGEIIGRFDEASEAASEAEAAAEAAEMEAMEAAEAAQAEESK